MTGGAPAHDGILVDIDLPRPGPGETWVVGALIADAAGRVFVQRRAADRRLFPGCWDIVGGHVEAGETLLEALAREVREETGWHLTRVRAIAGESEWRAADGRPRRELDVVATVRGDLDAPRLEWSKHSEYRWIGPDELVVLRQGRSEGDTMIHDLVAHYFAVLARPSEAVAPGD